MPTGGSVTFTAEGGGCDGAPSLEYQFEYGPAGSPLKTFRMLRPWASSPVATFAPPNGSYSYLVRVRPTGSNPGNVGTASVVVTLLSGNVCTQVELDALPPPPEVPGITVHLHATASCTEGSAEYQYVVREAPFPDRVLRDWGGPDVDWESEPVAGNVTLIVNARGAGNPGPPESTAKVVYVLSTTTTSATGCRGVGITSSSPGPIPSHGSVTLTATGVTCDPGQMPEYQFLYRREGDVSTAYKVFRAFGPSRTATFSNDGLPSGKYTLQVRARNYGSRKASDSSATLNLLSGNVCTLVTLGASPVSPSPPGSGITLTGSAACTENDAEYQFFYRAVGTTPFTELGPWGPASFRWDTNGIPIDDYQLMVRARGRGNTSKFESQSARLPYTLADRCDQVTLSVSPASPQTTGTSVTMFGAASCRLDGRPELRYTYKASGTPAVELLPWGQNASVVWSTTGLAPGKYTLSVESRPFGYSGKAQGSKNVSYTLTLMPNRPPVIRSNGGLGTAAVSVEENTTFVTTVRARDPDLGTTLTYSIAGGADATRFAIDAATGVLSFVAAPDYEVPADADTNNGYVVVVRASDGDLSATQELTVSVTDVDETASTPVITIPGLDLAHENQSTPLRFLVELADTDGSETLTTRLEFLNVEAGAQLTDGSHGLVFSGDPVTSIDVSGWNISALAWSTAPDSDADLFFVIVARAVERNGGATAEVRAGVLMTVVSEGAGVELSTATDTLWRQGRAHRLTGESLSSTFGPSVSAAGDFNGDGFDDVVIGAPSETTDDGLSTVGGVYVVFGGRTAPQDGDVSPLDGTSGVRLRGTKPGEAAGAVVTAAGDVNGDGFDDILVGGYSEAGSAYLVLGHAAPFLPSESLADAITLSGTGELSVISLSGAGDVNGDGLSDFLVGDRGIGTPAQRGGAFLVYGVQDGFQHGTLDLPSQSTGVSVIEGAVPGAKAGISLGAAGDVNGDGYDDVVIGTTQDPAEIGARERVHVVLGGATGVGDRLDLSQLDGTRGYEVGVGDPSLAIGLGSVVSGAGDLDGDNFDDLVISAPYATANGDRNAGHAFVIFGQEGRVELSEGLRSTRIDGAEADDLLGIAGGGRAGDLNGDGFDDLLLSQSGRRSAVAIFGHAGPFAPVMDLASLPAAAGMEIGWAESIVAAGDLDGDSIDDLLAGSPNLEVFVTTGPIMEQIQNTFRGTPNGDGLVVDEHQLLVRAGPGDDRIFYIAGATAKVSGGPGFDTLTVGGVDLDLTALNASAHYHTHHGINSVDMHDGAASTLTLDFLDFVHLTEVDPWTSVASRTLVVLGEAGDVIQLSADEWSYEGPLTVEGPVTLGRRNTVMYRSLRSPSAALFIEPSIEVRGARP